MSLRPAHLAIACGLLVLAGCGPAKLNESRTYTLNTGDAQALDLPAQKKAQKVTVEFTASAAEVLVLVFKEADAKGDEGLLTADPEKALGKKQGKADTVTVDVPENTATRVVVRATKAKTDVTLKVTNAK